MPQNDHFGSHLAGDRDLTPHLRSPVLACLSQQPSRERAQELALWQETIILDWPAPIPQAQERAGEGGGGPGGGRGGGTTRMRFHRAGAAAATATPPAPPPPVHDPAPVKMMNEYVNER